MQGAADLPRILGEEAVRFLARTATGVQLAETNHPSEVGERSWTISCPGVSEIQFHFDARSSLPRGSTLSIYLDAAGANAHTEKLAQGTALRCPYFIQ